MNESLGGPLSAYLTGTLHKALEVAFAPSNETEKNAAIEIVGVVLKNAATGDALAIVMGTLYANVAQDLVVANVLYEVHVACGSDALQPVHLFRLGRRAHQCRSLETLASILSVLANRPATLVAVERDWITTALEADLEAGHGCRAATLAEVLAAWPCKEKLEKIRKVRGPDCACP
jgi:hypothetical protein